MKLKTQRTKRQQLLLIENMNREAVNILMRQHEETGKFLAMVGTQMAEFQKEILAIRNCLKRRGIITEFDISQERSAMAELDEMAKKAIIIGEEKKE
jgi:hypothetical protein